MLNAYVYDYGQIVVHVKAINREDANIAFMNVMDRLGDSDVTWSEVEVTEHGKETRK